MITRCYVFNTWIFIHEGYNGEDMEFRQICLLTLDSTQEIYIPSNSQEQILQMYTHMFSLEVKMVAILTNLN